MASRFIRIIAFLACLGLLPALMGSVFAAAADATADVQSFAETQDAPELDDDVEDDDAVIANAERVAARTAEGSGLRSSLPVTSPHPEGPLEPPRA